MMELRKALRQLPTRKKHYFEWKFNVKPRVDLSNLSEQEFLDKYTDDGTTIRPFKEWERTPEYHALVNLYLQSQTANDLLEVYESVKEKAKQGDDKAVKQLLELQKRIKENSKEASKMFEEDEGDELILD
ncbi:hypothetical protein [Natranaerobius thermophilus]|uniref:Uncharacterized protein n=1 Tax=Natranaerobius thermophilus (strain ATCC BAA-1301 / DSM 18059 / JW/NM-WN-LF) TaxID=457570 RepID=B2A221_NATTJ|nr:hypothetical protein [Natranaerobius thermophilus]ACB84826.1 conserved hypothetical protein [Natranaerobius thermophilus JW/NM-WN-LF]